jgi:hypothetical protein
MDSLARHCDERVDRLRDEPGGAALCSAVAAASGVLGAAAADSAMGDRDGTSCADESRQARQDLPEARDLSSSLFVRAWSGRMGCGEIGIGLDSGLNEQAGAVGQVDGSEGPSDRIGLLHEPKG